MLITMRYRYYPIPPTRKRRRRPVVEEKQCNNNDDDESREKISLKKKGMGSRG